MKMRKMFAVALSTVFLGSAGALAGCGKNPGVVNDDKTLNVAMYKGGYGSGWIMEIEEAFEKLYETEGYKINILEPRTNLEGRTALSEMRLTMDTGVDLYLTTSSVTVGDVLDEEYGVCVENMDELYNSKPINFDGTEGEMTLQQLYNESESWKITDDAGSHWSYSYVGSVRGIVCNTKILSQYGITQLPRTTDELFEAYDAIYYGANGKGGTSSTGIYPTTWGGDNAFAYSLNSLYTNMAQIMGVDAYDEFFKMDYILENEETLKNGYTMYANEDFKEVLEVFIQQYDTAYSTLGSTTQKHDVAHGKLVMGNAAFMTDGEFFFNEVRVNFSNKLNDIAFINIPVISYLGEKLKLDGTGSDAEKCDEILRYMIDQVDAGKSVAEIKAATEAEFTITLTDDQVEKVQEARTIGYGGSVANGCYITKGTPKKHIAELFLRMMASEDAATVYTKYGMLNSYSPAVESGYQYEFSKGAVRIINSCKYFASATLYPGSLRARTNMFVLPPYNAGIPKTIAEEIGVVSNPSERDYAKLALETYNNITTATQKNWANYMSKAGYRI